MDKVAEFKKFVNNHKDLFLLVKDGLYSWQQLYEYYDLYGEDEEVWNKLGKEKEEQKIEKSLLNFISNIDPNKLQSGIESIQKFIGLLQVFAKEDKNGPEEKSKQFFRRFDD